MVIVKKRSNNQWQILSGSQSNVVPSDPPTGLAITSPTAGVLRVTWVAPVNTGNGDILKYKILIRVNGNPTIVQTVQANPTDTITLVTGLTNGVTYRAWGIVTNAAGDSAESTQSNTQVVSSAASYTLPAGLIIPSGWDNPATTGLFGDGWEYGDLTPYVGTLITSSDNQTIQGLDIIGSVIIKHKGVTITHCRIRNAQTSPTIIGGEPVVDGNQSLIVQGERVWLADNLTVTYSEIVGTLDANVNDQTGIGVGGSEGMHVDHCNLHDLSDALLPSGGSTTTHNLVYDMKVADGSHSDCLQITDGNNILVQDNTLICLTPDVSIVVGGDGVSRITPADGVGNAAIQLGAQTGPFTNVTINRNYLSGGGYTVNSNNSGEGANGPMTGTYSNNVFSGYFFRGAVGNYGSGMTFPTNNVWEATRVTTSHAGLNDSVERYWHLTGGGVVLTTTSTGTP